MPLGIQEHSNTVSLFKYAKALGANYILAKEIQNSNFSTVLEKVDTFLYKCNSAYITICTDVFSSAFAPGVSATQALGLIRRWCFLLSNIFYAHVKIRDLISVRFLPF